MDIRKLQRAIVDGLEDVKAQNIAVFNTEHLSPLFERVIIASGTSNRQTKALASSVRETVKKRGMDVLRTEGEDNGEWIIVDCGAAVAHILQPAMREYYNLEELWGGKNVNVKLGEKASGLVKASEPEPAPRSKAARAAEKVPAARKAPARKPASGEVPVRKTDAQKQADRTAAFKRVAAKSPARKPVARPAVKTSAGAPARAPTKAPVKTASKPTPKTATKTATKTVARKAPARKPAGPR